MSSEATLTNKQGYDVPTSLEGWRVFGLDRQGRLVAPFQRRYWPALADRMHWAPGVNFAECLSTPGCIAPQEDCTCGFRATEQFPWLLQGIAERRFKDSEVRIIDECGVIAKVRLSGRLLPGTDIPEDDPRTTWRSSQAEIIQIHLAPELEEHAERLHRIFDVPVAVYDAEEWPHQVNDIRARTPEREPRPGAFKKCIKKQYLGTAGFLGDRKWGKKPDQLARAILVVADEVNNMLIDGRSVGDIVQVLTETNLRPTRKEAKRFVEAVVEYLYPFDSEDVARAQLYTQPSSPLKEIARDLSYATRPLR